MQSLMKFVGAFIPCRNFLTGIHFCQETFSSKSYERRNNAIEIFIAVMKSQIRAYFSADYLELRFFTGLVMSDM